MKKLILLCLLAAACSTTRTATTENANASSRNTKMTPLLDDDTYLLTEFSDDADYGLTQKKPIKVGGVHEKSGPKNQRRFLNALLGPNGETLAFKRAGSCCPFRTSNGLADGLGMLDRYVVVNTVTRDTTSLYLNFYDTGELKIPVGFSAKK